MLLVLEFCSTLPFAILSFGQVCLICQTILISNLKDQDYRTCPKDVKPSKLIRLGGVPESATKDDVSHCFNTSKIYLPM